MESWERIQLIIEREGMNKTSFSKAIGLTNNVTITRIINEQRNPSRSTCEKIVSAFPQYNLDWLLLGEGEMLNEEASSNSQSLNQAIKGDYITYLLPMSALGGSLTGFAVPGTTLEDCEAIVSPIENVDFAITVYGESMAPEYPSGSRILIKKIDPDIFIDWGKAYVLDTENGVIVKEIHESEKDGCVRCYSINPNPKFKPFDVPLENIYGMYRVLMCMSAK